MLHLLNKPEWNGKFGVACSGGLDSMTAAHFCLKGGRRPDVLFFHHGIPEDEPGLEVVEKFVRENNLTIHFQEIYASSENGLSQEEHWRHERYNWLYEFPFPIFTGHHLDDVMETWIFSCLNGTPKLIPYNTNNIFRPFMLNTKKELFDWAVANDVEWHEDILNEDVRFARCRIRHNIMPEALEINPGLGKVMKKKLIKKYGNCNER